MNDFKPIGYLPLSQMTIARRTRRIGIFDIKLLKKQLKQFKDVEHVEIIAAEHKEGGYGLAVRPYGSNEDNWLTVCPLMEVEE